MKPNLSPDSCILTPHWGKIGKTIKETNMRPQLKKFIDAIGKDAVAIIPAAHEKHRSYDTEYKFRQDSDFSYLTGFPEPDAIAVITPSKRKRISTRCLSDRVTRLMETWYGRRQGTEGAMKNFGVR